MGRGQETDEICGMSLQHTKKCDRIHAGTEHALCNTCAYLLSDNVCTAGKTEEMPCLATIHPLCAAH